MSPWIAWRDSTKACFTTNEQERVVVYYRTMEAISPNRIKLWISALLTALALALPVVGANASCRHDMRADGSCCLRTAVCNCPTPTNTSGGSGAEASCRCIASIPTSALPSVHTRVPDTFDAVVTEVCFPSQSVGVTSREQTAARRLTTLLFTAASPRAPPFHA